MAAKRYRVLVGINYLPKGKGDTEKRAEPGEVVDDLPTGVVPVWLDQKVIEPEEASDGA